MSLQADDKRHLALLVDDEPDILELLQLTLQRMGVDTILAGTVTEARAALAKHPLDLCLTDMRLPDGTGIELVETIQREYPHVPVAVITAYGSMDLAIESLKAGAFDFVNKPVDLKGLRELIDSALRLSGRGAPKERRTRSRLLGDSPAMREIRSKITKLARSQAPVYISGESGTGKELVARLIHEQGPRAERPFVPVNCGAIPEDLMESEFFGHRRGSFTGATSDKLGLFQAADGGTLFLDEVADLPLHMQVKLLRAIQEKAIRPIGAQQEQHVDVRILSATHKDLGRMIKEGDFREDLFYRINVIQLHVPSLKERPEDIPALANHMLDKLSERTGVPRPALSGEATALLTRYPFPGNVRELENILERAITLCEEALIRAEDLDLGMATEPERREMTGGPVDLESHLVQIERDLIMDALERAEYNKTAAARQLGLSFRALRYRIKKLGLE